MLHLAPPAQTDRLYPEFIWNNLPPGLAGLLIAAILAAAMANLSAALNSLSSTVVVDFFHASSLRLARRATVAWGAVLLVIAIGASGSKSVLEAGLTIGSIPAGALLGVFLLGVLTKKPGERGGNRGRGRWFSGDSLRSVRNADRVDVVRSHRNRSNVRSGYGGARF